MTAFKLNRWHPIRVGMWRVGGLGDEAITRLMCDGRIVGLIAEAIVHAEWPKVFALQRRINKLYDLVSISTGRRWELKCLSSDGSWDISPSFMKGTGRTFDADLFREGLLQIDGFIFVDQRRIFPDIEVLGLNNNVLFDLSKLRKGSGPPRKTWRRESLDARIVVSDDA